MKVTASLRNAALLLALLPGARQAGVRLCARPMCPVRLNPGRRRLIRDMA
jgi:hypothetical protein